MKRLGVTNICGIAYTVEERTVEECPQLADVYAAVVHMQSLILVRAGLSPSSFRNALFHEIQHAIWEHSGLREVAEEEATDMSKFEERFIRVFTPHLITALASMKKWRAK